METALIYAYRFFVQPILMGSGKHFFQDRMDMTRLKLVESNMFSLGVVVLPYLPKRT
jgi:hypothetical protein